MTTMQVPTAVGYTQHGHTMEQLTLERFILMVLKTTLVTRTSLTEAVISSSVEATVAETTSADSLTRLLFGMSQLVLSTLQNLLQVRAHLMITATDSQTHGQPVLMLLIQTLMLMKTV